MKQLKITQVLISPMPGECLYISGYNFGFADNYSCYLVEIVCGSEKHEFYTDMFSAVCADLVPRAVFFGYAVTITPKTVKVKARSLHLYAGDFKQFSLV